MRNSSVALYLGCAALLVSGLGVTAWSAFDLKWPAEPAAADATGVPPPLYLQAATVQAPPAKRWPSDEGTPGVAFYGEMIELLTPPTSVMARHEEAEPATQGRRQGAARDTSSDSRRKAKTANTRYKREQQKQAGEPRRDEAEVVVRDRFGNPLRTQRVEREPLRGELVRREPEVVREPPRAYAPGPFQLFGPFFR